MSATIPVDIACLRRRRTRRVQEFLFGRRIRRGRWLVRSGRLSGQCGPGALESAGGRLLRRVEKVSDLSGREVEDVAQGSERRAGAVGVAVVPL